MSFRPYKGKGEHAEPTPSTTGDSRFGDAPRSWRAKWATTLLGRDRFLRLRVGRALLSAGVYVVAVVGIWINVRFGYASPAAGGWISAYMLAGPLIFIPLIRSGWSLRLKDPAMTMPQMLYALSALTLAYPVNSASPGLNLLLTGLLPMFGFQALSPLQARLLAGLSLSSFGLTMVLLTRWDPVHFDARVAVVDFLTAAICLPGVAILMGQISTIRRRVRLQRAELTQALARVQALSNTDELTGLANRRFMTERLNHEWALGKRRGARFCVALVDVDHFKRINDTYGHARGDEVLRCFSQIASQALGRSDILARWGGEEFLLLMPFRSLDDAAALLERVRQQVADASRWGGQLERPVTFSAGLTEASGASIPDVIERADQALYRAKAEGRDRVVTAW